MIKHFYITMYRKRIVIDWELLKRCAVRVSVKLKSLAFRILFKIISLLIFSQKKVITETSSTWIDKFIRNIIKNFILFWKFLQFFIKLEKPEWLDLIFKTLWIVIKNGHTWLFLIFLMKTEFRIVASLPFANQQTQKLFTG